MMLVLLMIAGAAVAVWHRVRTARGADPLGPPPAGELPDTTLALVLGALLWFVVREAASLVLAETGAPREEGFAVRVVAVTTMNLVVGLVLLRRATSGTCVPALRTGKLVLAGLFGGLVVFAAVGALGIAIRVACEAAGRPVPEQELVEYARSAQGLGLVTLALGSVVVAPFAEEVCFRGILLPAAVRVAGMRAGLAIQALSFGAIHVVSDWKLWPLAIPLAVVGWCCGRLYVRTGSLAVAVLVHATFNAINFAGLLAS
jgi:membrane protease YdiL (CAAX protease family)